MAAATKMDASLRILPFMPASSGPAAGPCLNKRRQLQGFGKVRTRSDIA